MRSQSPGAVEFVESSAAGELMTPTDSFACGRQAGSTVFRQQSHFDYLSPIIFRLICVALRYAACLPVLATR